MAPRLRLSSGYGLWHVLPQVCTKACGFRAANGLRPVLPQVCAFFPAAGVLECHHVCVLRTAEEGIDEVKADGGLYHITSSVKAVGCGCGFLCWRPWIKPN